MGSKKQRSKRKNERGKNTQPMPKKTEAVSRKTGEHTSSVPLYTALFMLAGMAVLAFIFTVILNTAVTDIYLKNHPELSGDNTALKAAVEAYINDNAIYNIVQRIVVNVSGILAIMMLFGRLEKESFPSVGFSGDAKRRVNIGMGALFSFLGVLVAYNILAAIGYVKPTGALVFNWVQLLWIADILVMCLFEEIFFRGYIGYKLSNYNMNYTIIISSVLFALYKGLPSTLPSTYITYIIMGVLLSYVSVKLKSVWFALSFRIVWTFTSGILLSIYAEVVPGIVENSGIKESLLSGNKSGFENGLIASAVLLICFILAKRMIENRNAPKQRRLHPDGTIR